MLSSRAKYFKKTYPSVCLRESVSKLYNQYQEGTKKIYRKSIVTLRDENSDGERNKQNKTLDGCNATPGFATGHLSYEALSASLIAID